jgi:hypothetical protein
MEEKRIFLAAISPSRNESTGQMQFVVSKQNLQKELSFVQGIVEKKNTIPVLSLLPFKTY